VDARPGVQSVECLQVRALHCASIRGGRKPDNLDGDPRIQRWRSLWRLVAAIGWLACFPSALGDKAATSKPMRVYKILLAWASLAMPLSWPRHTLGFLAFLRDVWGGRTSFDARTMNVRVIGGWLGRRTARGFTLGMFSFHNPERLSTSTLLHQSGHVLNYAAFGFIHLVFQCICLGNRNSMWERLAESHVPSGNRRIDAYDQDDDWPRLRMWGPGAVVY